MKESLQNIGDLIAEPSAAFLRLKLQPRSGIAFILFYLFSVLIGWGQERGRLKNDSRITSAVCRHIRGTGEP